MNISPLIDFSAISTGSLLGANLRYFLITKFCSIKLSKSRRLLLVNLIASVILGASLSLNNKSDIKIYRELFVLFLFGFAGSLSTFSSFINDLFKLSINFEAHSFRSCIAGISIPIYCFRKLDRQHLWCCF